MNGNKLRFSILAMSLMVVKGMTIDDNDLKESRIRPRREFVNTSINTRFMLQEITRKHSGAGSVLFKPRISFNLNKYSSSMNMACNTTSTQAKCNISELDTKIHTNYSVH